MALGVRACSQSVEIYVALIGSYVLLESLQIQHQGRGRQLTQATRLAYESPVRPGEMVHFIN
jgi:hypothetical protein